MTDFEFLDMLEQRLELDRMEPFELDSEKLVPVRRKIGLKVYGPCEGCVGMRERGSAICDRLHKAAGRTGCSFIVYVPIAEAVARRLTS